MRNINLKKKFSTTTIALISTVLIYIVLITSIIINSKIDKINKRVNLLYESKSISNTIVRDLSEILAQRKNIYSSSAYDKSIKYKLYMHRNRKGNITFIDITIDLTELRSKYEMKNINNFKDKINLLIGFGNYITNKYDVNDKESVENIQKEIINNCKNIFNKNNNIHFSYHTSLYTEKYKKEMSNYYQTNININRIKLKDIKNIN